MSVEILFPVARMIGGNVYVGQPVIDDRTKQPEIGNDGQPKKQFLIGFAIKKNGEQHWAQTEWGAKMYTEGATAFPREYQGPRFAWKITDGDSTIPNANGNVPSQQEGYAGHWVIWGRQGWAPVICNDQGTILIEKDIVYPGCFVQVVGTITGNNSTQSPGVYVNPAIVAFIAHGHRINTTANVNPSAYKFGGALPPGASAEPLSNLNATAQPPGVALPQMATPNPSFLRPAVPPTMAPVPPPTMAPVPPPTMAPVPPPAPVHRMTPLAQGATYEQMIAAGWTDALLKQHGMMV